MEKVIQLTRKSYYLNGQVRKGLENVEEKMLTKCGPEAAVLRAKNDDQASNDEEVCRKKWRRRNDR